MRTDSRLASVAAGPRKGEHAPVGQPITMRSYPAEDNHCCAAPNADTLYDTDYFFVPNAINRFELSQRNDLVAAAGEDAAMNSRMSIDGKASV